MGEGAQSRTDCVENKTVRPVDDLVDRRSAGEHRRRLRQNLVAGWQVRQMQVPQHFDCAGLRGG